MRLSPTARSHAHYATPVEKALCSVIGRIESNSVLADDDIKELEGYPGYYRWKPSKATMCDDTNIRVIYRYLSATSIEIVDIGPRGIIYNAYKANRSRYTK